MNSYPCGNCGKLNEYRNYCNWECSVSAAMKAGGKKHLPNGLPVGSIRHDNEMFEHEHGDHPDYKFPVEIEWIGQLTDEHREDFKMISDRLPKDDEELRSSMGETHALIYTDGNIVLTMYECCYAMWHLHDDGRWLGGSLWSNKFKLNITHLMTTLNKMGDEQQRFFNKAGD